VGSEVQDGERLRQYVSTIFKKRCVRFWQYNSGNRGAALRPRRFCHANSRSLEAGRYCVGIAERDGFVWVCCIVGASRKGPVRARCNCHSASSRQCRCYTHRAATSQALPQRGSHSESVELRRLIPADLLRLAFLTTSSPGFPFPKFSPAFASA
jgi:hypothetical protein